ncbi:MAG TPA: regulatory protein RecX [Myxococcales bacterium]
MLSRPRKAPRKATALYLERAALHHLQRYSTTKAGLRQVLMRRVSRSAKAHGTDVEQGKKWIEDLVARFERAGLLDDARFAKSRATSLLQRGTSPRAIALKLRAKGVQAPEVRQAMDAIAQESANPELDAAMALAKRKRIGPFARVAATEPEERRKHLGVLMRAGFSYGVAKKVLAAEV